MLDTTINCLRYVTTAKLKYPSKIKQELGIFEKFESLHKSAVKNEGKERQDRVENVITGSASYKVV